MNENILLQKINKIKDQLNEHVIGQEHLTNALLIAFFCDGHLLIEGLPGLAKTRAVKNFSEVLSANFGRIQFTPDMLPSDITGNDIFDSVSHSFHFRKGPVFTNLLLADEINRAPAKVQAALLEAMQEKQVTVNGKTYPLPDPFMVLATQNPFDQEGTFILPEAQKDRFLMNVVLDYPSEADELRVLRLVRSENQLPYCTEKNHNVHSEEDCKKDNSIKNHNEHSEEDCKKGNSIKNSDNDSKKNSEGGGSWNKCSPEELNKIKEEISQVYISEAIEKYIIKLVQATRPNANNQNYINGQNLIKNKDGVNNQIEELDNIISYGAGPRASLALDICSRAVAWLSGRNYVTGDDVKYIAKDVLYHRITISLRARHEGWTIDRVIDTLLKNVTIA